MTISRIKLYAKLYGNKKVYLKKKDRKKLKYFDANDVSVMKFLKVERRVTKEIESQTIAQNISFISLTI